MDESPELLEALAVPPRRLVVDSSIGEPRRCLDLLVERIALGQAVNDLNWLRLFGEAFEPAAGSGEVRSAAAQ